MENRDRLEAISGTLLVVIFCKKIGGIDMLQEKDKKNILNGQEMELDENGNYVEVKKETTSGSLLDSRWFTSTIVAMMVVLAIVIVYISGTPIGNHSTEKNATSSSQESYTLAELKEEQATKEATPKKRTSKAKKTYSLTIKYVHKKGGSVYPETRLNLAEGEKYDVSTPTLEGLVANKTAVKDTMKARNTTVTVIYTDAKKTPHNDPMNDPAYSGNAMVGGGSSQ